ncbi:hypothetical protein HYR54_07720 [Candidatus Acetothermia bacterium]|nr:hypothetical protein [Candidatus Acetothermia bacterium]
MAVYYIHRALGYSLTADTTEQCLFLCYGTGANGKTVFLSALRHALGDYGINTPFETFEDVRNRTATNDVAALYRKRFVTSSETKERARLNEARIKAMTGCDPVTARFLYREYFTYTPSYKIWLAVNHKPGVADESYGFWRRIRLIPFKTQFPPDRADKQLSQTLSQEASGILSWAVQGCLNWQSKGLEPPQVVKDVTEEYRSETDLIGQFLVECCVVGGNAWCRASQLFNEFKSWCVRNGIDDESRGSATTFGRRIVEHGFFKKHTKTGKVYEGLRLLAENSLESNV